MIHTIAVECPHCTQIRTLDEFFAGIANTARLVLTMTNTLQCPVCRYRFALDVTTRLPPPTQQLHDSWTARQGKSAIVKEIHPDSADFITE
jgi:C4-type Zn-finger protein